MATQVIAINGTSQATAAFAESIRVKVVASAPFFYAVGSNPTAYAGNCKLFPAGKGDIILGALNQKVAVLGAGVTGNVSLTEIGTVSQRTLY